MEERELAHEVAARLEMDEGTVAEVVHEVLDVMGASEVGSGPAGKGPGYGYGGSDDEPGALERGGGYGYGGSDDDVGGGGYGPGGS